MPRFKLSTLHIVFAVVVLWLSTLTGYKGAEDIRAFIMLGCLISSGVAAWACSAHRRAFWLGFFGTMLAAGQKGLLANYGASFIWAQQISANIWWYLPIDPSRVGPVTTGIGLTIVFALTLVIATAIGLVCVYVYDQ